MDHVLTLVADPATQPLTAEMLARVRDALDALGGDTLRPGWLSPERAADIPFALLSPDQAEAAALAQLAGLAVDVVAQPVAQRRKRLLIADMDSTMVRGETLDELAEAAGLKAPIAAITERAMRGEIDFAGALVERVAMLKGLAQAALGDTVEGMALMPGAEVLVRTMRANGAHAVLVSGGFRAFTEVVKRRCGFDEAHGNTLEIAAGRLTGRVVPPIIDAQGKLSTLTTACAARSLPLAAALAVGDGANDVPMLRAAGLGVAYHAKPAVRAAARARVEHGDLTALLYLQGYRDEDFA